MTRTRFLLSVAAVCSAAALTVLHAQAPAPPDAPRIDVATLTPAQVAALEVEFLAGAVTGRSRNNICLGKVKSGV